MTKYTLPDVFVGDEFLQALTIQQAGQDFTGFSVTGELTRNGGGANRDLDVTAALAAGDNSTIDVTLKVPGDSGLPAGTYTGKARLTTPTFGPTTVFLFEVNFVP